MRESATTKIYMIDDLLDEAESSLTKDQEEEARRDEVQRQRAQELAK